MSPGKAWCIIQERSWQKQQLCPKRAQDPAQTVCRLCSRSYPIYEPSVPRRIIILLKGIEYKKALKETLENQAKQFSPSIEVYCMSDDDLQG